MLAFYMDHQFPVSVSRGLNRRGVDVLTAFDDGAQEVDDEQLLIRATELGRVLVTHDKGFLRRAAEWQIDNREFTGIVFAVQKSMVVGLAIEYLETMAHVLEPHEMRNRVEHIPVR
jgi:predicted nuclease of predicted toxin-antitoxin system